MEKEYPPIAYAGFWLRFWAYLIDLILFGALRAMTLGNLFRLLRLPTTNSLLSAYGIISLVLFLGYFILFTKRTNGQTLGKIVMGLRIVSKTQETLSWDTVLFREGIGRFISSASLGANLPYLVVAFAPMKRGIADMFADTYVVKEDYLRFFESLPLKDLTDKSESLLSEPVA